MRYNPISDKVWEYMVTNNCSENEANLAIKKQLRDIAIEARNRLAVIETERLERMYKYNH